MDLTAFGANATGSLVDVSGRDLTHGAWHHKAFVPAPLPDSAPQLSMLTMNVVAEARAALGSLDSTARRLPNPALFRIPALRREAQSTSALEGTYAPLDAVLIADESTSSSPALREVLNYEQMASQGFDHVLAGRALTPTLLEEFQGTLMRGTGLAAISGRIRTTQVVVGRRSPVVAGAPIHTARYVPPPPGIALEAAVKDLTEWMGVDRRRRIDPVVATAMSHYQFEALHPFPDGNGRVGRFLIVVELLVTGVLSEPTLTVSPWFEARRHEYYDRLLAVSTDGAWDEYVAFFAEGIGDSAVRTQRQMDALVAAQEELHDAVRSSSLRAESNHKVVDLAVARPAFSIKEAAKAAGVSITRANGLVNGLVDLGILRPLGSGTYDRRFASPLVLEVLTRRTEP